MSFPPAARSRSQGSITKTGNSHVRRLLVEAAWHHRPAYRPGKTMHDRWALARRCGAGPWRCGEPAAAPGAADWASECTHGPLDGSSSGGGSLPQCCAHGAPQQSQHNLLAAGEHAIDNVTDREGDNE